MSSQIEAILEQLARGVEGMFSREELGRKLEASARDGRPLRIKLGMDPTAPDLHLGHTVVLRKMRQFQDLGHTAVLIIGDYTARIGDPTGRDVTRPMLDEQTIKRNAETYLSQAGKVLLTSPDRLEVCWNAHWLSKLSFADVLRLTGQVTVQQMLHRENFKLRMEQGREIVLSEFMYPIMQGYDSVVVRSDVELGGTDQTFNNLIGRDLMAHAGLERQVVMVMPILVGLDGQDKMSKSKGNYVAITDPPDQMFGKIMSIPDSVMPNYFQLLTDLPKERLTSLLDPKVTHPRAAKDILAQAIVESFHTTALAHHASEEFRRRFAEHQLPGDLEVKTVSRPTLGVIDLLREVGFATSNSEARRLVEGGGVTIAGQKIGDPKANLTIKGGEIVQVGKRRVCKVALPSQ